MSKLSIELVPQTAWWSNVRSNVTRAQWEVCKRYANAKTGGVCIVCGDVGQNQNRKHAVEAHEIWDYDDERQIQTLVDIVPLCPRCHQVKHIGRSQAVMSPYMYDQLVRHLCRVNGWWNSFAIASNSPNAEDTRHAQRYINTCFEVWAERSRHAWELDITFLKMLGLEVEAKNQGSFQPHLVSDWVGDKIVPE